MMGHKDKAALVSECGTLWQIFLGYILIKRNKNTMKYNKIIIHKAEIQAAL